MDSVISQLLVGGYALPNVVVPDDLPVDIVDARVFSREGLLGRQIVRLTARDLGEGEDAAMDLLGFTLDSVTPGIALRKRQALGFPDWVLVHAPKDAARALAVGRQLRKEARKAASKPGAAKSIFDAIIADVAGSTPHFLPTLCEQMGRVFIESGNISYAAIFFGKARDAEQKFGLDVDEKRRRSVFLEFSLCGAVTAKAMTEYAKDLAKRHGDATAYEFWTDIVIRRTLGGNPPTAAMFKELKKIAKAAGVKPEAAEDLVLSQIWESPSLSRAPGAVWDALEGAYLRLSKSVPEAGAHLLSVFPNALSSDAEFAEFWLGFLIKMGSIEALEKRTQAGSLARWLTLFVEKARSGSWYQYSRFCAAGIALIQKWTSRLKNDGVTIVIGGEEWGEQADLELLDLLLELEIPVDPGTTGFSLHRWTRVSEEEIPLLRGLEFIAAHPAYGPRLDEAVGAVIDEEDFHKAAQGKAGLSGARERWLLGRLRTLATGSVASFGQTVEELVDATTAATFAEFPAVWEALQNLDVVAPLVSTFHHGFLAEFDWKAAREAAKELGEDVEVSGVFPYLALHNGKRAIVLKGDERVLEHDFKLKKGDRAQELRFAGGQLLVSLYDDEYDRKMYWSGNPKNRLDCDYMGYQRQISFHRADGSVVEGLLAYRAGDPEYPTSRKFITDGETFWANKSWEEPNNREFDPDTGAYGRESLPKVIEDRLEDGWVLDARELQVYPAPVGSPLGSVDGLFFNAIFNKQHETIVKTPLGQVTSEVYSGLLRMPGGGALCAIESGFELHDQNSRVLDIPESMAGLELDFPFFHYFRAVDESGSKRLRGASHEAAAAVLGSVIAESKSTKPMPELWASRLVSEKESAKALKELLGDSPLSEAVLQQVKLHIQRIQSLADHVMAADPRFAVDPADSIPDSVVWVTFESMASGGECCHSNETWDDERELKNGIEGLNSFFRNGIIPPVFANYSTDFSWIFRFTPVLGWVAALPQYSEQREAVLKFIETLATSGLLDLAEHLVMFESSQKSWKKHGVEEESRSFFVENGTSRFFGSCEGYEDETYKVLAYSEGDLELPSGVKATDRFQGVPWSSKAALQLVEAVREHGGYGISREAAERIAETTGLAVGEAALLWTGLHNVESWSGQIMDTDTRKAFKLSAAEVKLARDVMRAVPGEKRSAIFAAALPADPSDFWEQPLQVAESLAKAWNAQMGKRRELPQDVILAVEKDLVLDDARAAILGLYDVPSFKVGGALEYDASDKSLSIVMADGAVDVDSINEYLRLAPYLFYMLPVGHEVHKNIPAYFDALKTAFFAPDVLLPTTTAHEWMDDSKKAAALLKRLGADKTMKGVSYYDDGFVVFVLSDWGLNAGLRPARLAAGDTSSHLDADNSEVFALKQLPLLENLIRRLQDSPLSAGEFEANPRSSVPELVAAVKAELGVSEAAAMAFLQTLAMPDPSTKNLRFWNDWSAAVYKKAFAELVEKGVVLEAKRARSGRSFFLDGPWLEFRSPRTPLEEWKLSMMPLLSSENDMNFPAQPAHELFEKAWTRWRDGDKPGFTK